MKTNGSRDGFQEILKHEFERRCTKNSQYTLRAFARDLRLSPAACSKILNGKLGLSPKKAVAIAQSLGLNDRERDRFLDLIAAKHSRNFTQRKLAQKRLAETQDNDYAMSAAKFKVISDWYHFAILELAELKDFQGTAKWVSEALGIRPSIAQTAIDRLLSLGYLQETERGLKPTLGYVATASEVPSVAIKNFHEQLLDKSRLALHTQSLEEREFSNTMMAISAQDLPKIKARLREFRRSLAAEFTQSEERDQVYVLSSQFFNLTESFNFPKKEKTV